MKRPEDLAGVEIMDPKLESKIRHIVDVLNRGLGPRKIIVFGSYARGNANPDSDLDILLVMDDSANRRETAVAAYRLLGPIGISKDIVVVTESDIRDFGTLPGTVLQPALAEGKVVYEKAA
jgi:predicted nucleotidyltransferase